VSDLGSAMGGASTAADITVEAATAGADMADAVIMADVADTAAITDAAPTTDAIPMAAEMDAGTSERRAAEDLAAADTVTLVADAVTLTAAAEVATVETVSMAVVAVASMAVVVGPTAVEDHTAAVVDTVEATAKAAQTIKVIKERLARCPPFFFLCT
jgi:hypothetical protein